MLNITNLYADYGGKPALEDINLTLDSGELLVVLGPSGCGKTTLLNLIAGFVPYQHGTIQLEGKKVEGPGAERGVVFQNEGLLPWRNVQENVAFGLQLAGINREKRLAMAREMLKKVGLEGAEKRFIWQLSGGQRQRVGIARALAQQPNIILADEPVASLDPATSEKILELLRQVCKEDGITAIVSLHQLEYAQRFADRIIGLAGAHVVFDGAPDELNDDNFAAIYAGHRREPIAPSLTSNPAYAQPPFTPEMEMSL